MGICNNRTVIITGAGGGLGKAYAEALAAEGANVVVNDIRLDAAQAVVDGIGVATFSTATPSHHPACIEERREGMI